MDGLPGVSEARTVPCVTGGDVRSASDERRVLATCLLVPGPSLDDYASTVLNVNFKGGPDVRSNGATDSVKIEYTDMSAHTECAGLVCDGSLYNTCGTDTIERIVLSS